MFGNFKDRLHNSNAFVRLILACFIGGILLISSLLAFEQKNYAYALATSTWDGTTVASSFAGGDGSEESPYLISSAGELAKFMQSVSDTDNFYLLTKDIDWNNNDWTYSQEFSGHFDGGRHTISNVVLNNVKDGQIGLFPVIDNATIQNLSLEFNGATISAYASKAGALVGSSKSSTLHNCIVRGLTLNTRLVSLANADNTYLGGLIGYADSTTITSSSFVGQLRNLSINSYVGGLVGYMSNGSISDSFVISTDICASATYVQPDSDTNTYTQTASGLIGSRIGVDVKRVYVSANLTATHTYTVTEGNVTKPTGIVYAISQDQGTTSGAYYDSERSFSSSNYVNTNVGTAKTSTELTTIATYDSWATTGVNFTDVWVIDSLYNGGYPIQRVAVGREIKVSTLLQDQEGNTITTTDANWAKISTNGSGMYLATDFGASTTETAVLSLQFDGISNETAIGYTFEGYMFKGAFVSTERTLSIVASESSEGQYYAVFTKTIFTPTVNIKLYDRVSDEYEVYSFNTDVATLSISSQELVVQDEYKYIFNLKSDLIYTFVGWQVNGEIIDATTAQSLINGELSGDGNNTLSGTVVDEFISTYSQDGTLEISALLKYTQYTVNIVRMNSTGANLDYCKVNGKTETSTVVMQVGDRLILNCTTADPNSATAIVSVYYETNITDNGEHLLGYIQNKANSVIRELTTTMTLDEDLLNEVFITNNTFDIYVDFRNVIKVTASGDIDNGEYDEQFSNLSALVRAGGELSNEVYAYQGQNIELSYYIPQSGIELTKFVKRTLDSDGNFALDSDGNYIEEDLFGGSTSSGTAMVVDEDTHIVAKYTRKIYDYAIHTFSTSSLEDKEIAVDSLIEQNISSTVSNVDENGQTFYSILKHYDNVTLTARLLDSGFKIIGFKWVQADTDPDVLISNIESATLVQSPTTSHFISYSYEVTDEYDGKILYLVYTKVNMSVDFNAGVVGAGLTTSDVPADLVLYQNDEEQSELYLRDIIMDKTIKFTAKTKPGYEFIGWYKDGTLITTDANAGYNASKELYTPIATEGVNTFVIDSFDSELSGIYSARYEKVLYTITVSSIAGNNILSVNNQTTNNTIQAYVQQTINVSYTPLESKKIIGLSTLVGGAVEFTNSILLTSDLLELADADKVLNLYQIYEDKYLLTINVNDVEHSVITVEASGNTFVYTQPIYLDKNTNVVLTVQTSMHYHYEITGLDADYITENGAEFDITENMEFDVAVAIDTFTVTIITEEGYQSAGTIVGAGEYAYNTRITVSVTTNPGFRFEKWQKKMGAIFVDHTYTNSFALEVKEDIELKALFIELYNIQTSVSDEDGGSITPSFTLVKGTMDNIEVTLNPGYYVKAWYKNADEMSDMANKLKLVVKGEMNAHYHVEIALIQYTFNLDQLKSVYGESGYTITAPQNGTHYVYGETVHFALNEIVNPIRLNAVYANAVQKISSAHVTNEHKAEFDIKIDDVVFVNYACEIILDYTRIYNVTVERSHAEANMPTINEIGYISRKENTVDGVTYYTYSVLDGTTITVNSSSNAKYLFREYSLWDTTSSQYMSYSDIYETDFLIDKDTKLMVKYIGVAYSIDYVYFVLDENGDVIEDFPISYLSAPTYTYTYNGTTDTTYILRYGDIIDITMTSAPYGTSLHHFASRATTSTGTITVNMDITSNITVEVYLTRIAITVNVENLTAEGKIKVDGLDVLRVVGNGSYYIGEPVEISLTNDLNTYFEVTGWQLNGNNLNFVARKAGYEKMIIKTYSGFLKITFDLVPFDNTNTITFAPVVAYKLFKVSSTVVVDGQKDTRANPVATTQVKFVRLGSENIDSSNPSENSNIQYKDKVVVSFIFNTDYADQYMFAEMTLSGVKIAGVVQSGNQYSYTIDSFVSNNKGDYKIKFLSKLSTIHLGANLEKAIQEGALTKNQDQYAIDDTVTISVDNSKINPGYAFQGWYQETTLLTNNYQYTFTFSSSHAGKTFTAMFQAINYNIEIRSSANGGVFSDIDENDAGVDSLVGTALYNAEEGLIMYFIPAVASGYHIEHIEYGMYNNNVAYLPNDASAYYTEDAYSYIATWELDFGLVASLITSPEDDTFVISVSYELRKYNVYISTTLDGATYTDEPLLNYDINGEGEITELVVTHGTSFIITFSNIKYGYKLKGEIDNKIDGIAFDNGNISYVDLTYTVADVIGSGNLNINIERELFTVTVTSSNTQFGVVSGSGQYAIGDTVTFSATVRGSGYEFVGFSYKGEKISTDLIYSFKFEVKDDGDYSYKAEFKIRAVRLYSGAYVVSGKSYTAILDAEGNSYSALTFQSESGYITDGYFSYGSTVQSYFRNIEGYTCAESYVSGSIVNSLSFNIDESLIKASENGEYEIKVIYTINTYDFTLKSNFTDIRDQNGKKIKPADLKYKVNNKGGFKSEGSGEYEYKTDLKIHILSFNYNNYTFEGIYENGTLIYEPEGVDREFEYNYELTKDTVLIVHYTPKIEFKNFTDADEHKYISEYTSYAQGIDKERDIDIVSVLKPFLVVKYNGSADNPVNVGEYSITVSFSLESLKDISISGATYVITPITITFSFTGTISKVYDGTASITDFSGLKFTDNLIKPNDKGYIFIDISSTTARFIKKVDGSNYDQAQVGSGYAIEFRGIQLAVSVSQYENRLNNYILSNYGQEFKNVGTITPKEIYLQGVYLANKVFDDTTDVVYSGNYSINNSYIEPTDLITIGGVVDDVSLDYNKIKYNYSTKEVGENIVAVGTIEEGSTGLLGAKANNYKLILPSYSGFTIHPYQLTASGDYGTITITDINRELFLPLDLRVAVDVISPSSDAYRHIYTAIEPNLAGNKNFETAYTIKLLRNSQEYFINGSIIVDISTPENLDDAKITNVLYYGDSINDLSITANKENIMFATGSLGTFVLVSQSNPVPLWVIILVSVILLLVIVVLCIYFFIIQPKKREKAYAKFNQI